MTGNLIFRKRPTPVEVVYLILELFSEEELKFGNSCKLCNFEIALLAEFCRTKVKFKFKNFEEAIPQIKEHFNSIKPLSTSITHPQLFQSCYLLKETLFYEP